jgi:DNA-binding response OmpR family regulator
MRAFIDPAAFSSEGPARVHPHLVASVVMMPKVLVVDDEETKRGELEGALRHAGFETRGVSSHDAAQEASESRFDLAIIDLMLHGTNGFELARRMRSVSPAVRVVLTSAYHFTEHQLARIDCGAVGFVPQPFAVDELTAFLWSKLANVAPSEV